MSYKEAYDEAIINNTVRNNLLLSVVNKFKDTKKIIILTKYRAHNKILLNLIPNSVCIDSFTPRKQRKNIFNNFKNNRDIIMISTTQIFSSGINVPDSDIMINASATKSQITTLQSIGRIKRKAPNKTYGVFIDFIDTGTSKFKEYSNLRIKYLEEYKNICKIIDNIDEMDDIYAFL